MLEPPEQNFLYTELFYGDRITVTYIRDHKEWQVRTLGHQNSPRAVHITIERPKVLVTPKKRKVSVVQTVRESVLGRDPNDYGPPKEYRLEDTSPSPYTLTINIERHKNKVMEDQRRVIRTGVLMPYDHHRAVFRIDALLESIKLDEGGPYEYFVQFRIASHFNPRYNLRYTGQHMIHIGGTHYEIVSREILGLFSKHFFVLFYGRFREAATNAATTISPVFQEKAKEFRQSVNLMLESVQNLSHKKLDTYNVMGLLEKVHRYDFYKGTFNRIDKHLIHLCNNAKNDLELDGALYASVAYDLERTQSHSLRCYKDAEAVGNMVYRIGELLPAAAILRIFDTYKTKSQHESFIRKNFIYFDFRGGQAIIQLNRIKLPQTVPKLIDQFLGTGIGEKPAFHWDNKDRLISVHKVPYSIWTTDETASHRTVPSEKYALIMRCHSNGICRYSLTKQRPTDAVYLGFVVKGDEIITPGLRFYGTGVYNG